MQQRIMGRYDATQATDISSLRDVREAQRAVIDYRDILLNDAHQELTRSLKLSEQLSPTEEKIRGLLEKTALREPEHDPFPERRALNPALQERLIQAEHRLAALPAQRAELLMLLESTQADEVRLQRQLAETLITLDELDEELRGLATLVTQRHAQSSAKLNRDQQRADQLTIALLIFAFFAFLVATGTIWSALRPIQRLTHAASKVAQGDFSVEPIRAGKDEVGQLADAFVQMTRALAERDAALVEANQDLEEAYQNLIREEQARIQAERLAVVGELSARITHELRNPLSSLNLNVEMILEDPKLAELEEDTREMLQAMEREIKRLEDLSSGYLSLAKKPTGMHRLLNFAELIRTVVAQFRRAAELNDIEVHSDFPDTLHLRGDENELRQVLINLIENARIALADLQGPKKLYVSAHTSDDHIELRVEDNGLGVDATMLEALFEAFSTSRKEGTGLGLSTSRRIAELHGGSLRYASRAEGGACFILQLPHASPDEI